MTEFHERLLGALKQIKGPGVFCTSGRLPAAMAGLEVARIGPVTLPLNKRTAAAMKKKARQAPYGKGTETVVDTDVRRVWEIDADQVELTNPVFGELLAECVLKVQAALGIEKQKLAAHLYKLLVYEPGSFFLSHRDGEKVDRMVATLVIVLPTEHTGGELIVRHDGNEQTIDFGPHSRFDIQYAAFYADCEHEIRPVTEGHRLTLVYNLTVGRAGKAVAAPRESERVAALSALLTVWQGANSETAGAGDDDMSPAKLAVLLDHRYSEAGLAFDALKGADRGKALALFKAAEQAGFDASLALVTYWESGAAEPSYDYDRYSRSRYMEDEADEEEADEHEDGEHTMAEVFDESLSASQFSDAAGKSLAFGQMRLRESELIPPGVIAARKPDREDFEGYTGNAGMTLERWYHRAAVILWPRAARFDVLCAAGVHNAVGALEPMIALLRRARKAERPALRADCVDFARQIIAHWPERVHSGGRSATMDDGDVVTPPADPLLVAIAKLDDVETVGHWLRRVLARDATAQPGTLIGDLCVKHGWSIWKQELQSLFTATTNDTLERNARLLADLADRPGKAAERDDLVQNCATALIEAIERWKPEDGRRSWEAARVNRRALLLSVTRALLAGNEPALLERLVGYVEARQTEFNLNTIQVPVLLAVKKTRSAGGSVEPLERWWAAARRELERRAATPPQPPSDWRRNAKIPCKCADCASLARFMNDPSAPSIRLPLPEARRNHLHGMIQTHKLDATHVTERRGSPYVLVCTKTNGSFDRLVEAHRVDVKQLEEIRVLDARARSLRRDPT